MNKTRKISSVVAGLAITAASVLPFANASAVQGPMSRPTFELQNPANYITFNSITNNPAVYNGTGDERDFVKVSATANTYGLTENLTVANSQEVYVLAYVHNDAREDLNLVAQDVMSKFDISQKSQLIDGKYVLTTTGYVNSSNANPTSVYDDAKFTADKPFSVSYVQDSAQFANALGVHKISDPTVGSGATLGYDTMNGRIPGCMSFSGWVSFKVKVNYEASDYSLEKSVRFDGQGASDWKEQIDAKTGDVVNFKLVYTHTGDGTQSNVTMIDKLPAGLEYVVGTTRIKNTLHPNNDLLTSFAPNADTEEKNITTNGINIGNYTGNSNAIVTFSARVKDANLLAACGANSLTNTARVLTEHDGEKSDTASVVVTKVCTETPEEPETPVTPTPDPVEELPTTGAEMVGILGFGSTLTAALYYVLNRKKA